MRDTERGVSYYDLFVESKAHGEKERHPVPVPLESALDIAHAKWGGNPFSVGDHVRVTLADWVRNPVAREDYILINRADATLNDIPLRHIDTGAMRMAGKDVREGIDLSCHVFIRRSRRPNKPALLLMTNGSFLTTDKLCSLLGALLRMGKDDPANAEHFRRDHPSGVAGKTIALHSSFSLAGHQNATLADLLRGGELQGVELISEGVERLDAASPLDITSVQVTLQPTGVGRVGVATIQRAIQTLRGRGTDPSKARVRYKPPGRSTVESHTFEIGALESAFVRRETIRFIDPIAHRSERVEMQVMERLIVLANREGGA